MALSIMCTTCRRNVYLDEQQTPVCPVCSAPLINAEALEGEAPNQGEPHGSNNNGGSNGARAAAEETRASDSQQESKREARPRH